MNREIKLFYATRVSKICEEIFYNGPAIMEITDAKLKLCAREYVVAGNAIVNQPIMGIFKSHHHFMKKGEGNA